MFNCLLQTWGSKKYLNAIANTATVPNTIAIANSWSVKCISIALQLLHVNDAINDACHLHLYS